MVGDARGNGDAFLGMKDNDYVVGKETGSLYLRDFLQSRENFSDLCYNKNNRI